jgi:hypothetical protein
MIGKSTADRKPTAAVYRDQSVDEMIDRLRRRAEGYIPIQCHVTFVKRLTSGFAHFVDRHPLVVSGLMLLFVVWAVASGVWLAIAVARG